MLYTSTVQIFQTDSKKTREMTGAHKNMNRPVNSKNQLSLSKLSRDDIYTQKYRSRAFLVTGGDARTKKFEE